MGLMSVDHLVSSGEQRGRHGKAEGPCGACVDHELKFGWLQDREVGARE
jgi:hypothetical protein